MRAAVLDGYGEGTPSVRDFPDPVPAPGEALVRLRAAALNRVDLYMRGGGRGITHSLPLVLGLDGAGEVVSAPPGSGLAPGRRGVGCRDRASPAGTVARGPRPATSTAACRAPPSGG